MKWAFVVWSVLATVLAFLALTVRLKNETVTHVFCAYGRVFVEFEEDGKKWGTIMLDYSGRPMPCNEESDTRIENTI